jgi:hypothetical protein
MLSASLALTSAGTSKRPTIRITAIPARRRAASSTYGEPLAQSDRARDEDAQGSGVRRPHGHSKLCIHSAGHDHAPVRRSAGGADALAHEFGPAQDEIRELPLGLLALGERSCMAVMGYRGLPLTQAVALAPEERILERSPRNCLLQDRASPRGADCLERLERCAVEGIGAAYVAPPGRLTPDEPAEGLAAPQMCSG